MNLLLSQRTALLSLLGGLLIASAVPPSVQAQNDGTNGPPNVLVMQREMLKPGKSGSTHEQTERNFVQAMAAAKSTSHYFGMDSMSGPSRSLFFAGFNSFAAWEKDNHATRDNASLAAAIDHASVVDGELLEKYEQNVFALRPDMSLNMGNLLHMRYMEVLRFEILPGHEHDWEDIVKMYVEGYKKAVPEAHWVTYEMAYGVADGGVFLVLNPLKSLDETDRNMADSKKFVEAIGPVGMKRMAELTAASVKSQQSNLFEFNPKISYPQDEWIKAEPEFWKPAPAAKRSTK
jgi:hypothetical protein